MKIIILFGLALCCAAFSETKVEIPKDKLVKELVKEIMEETKKDVLVDIVPKELKEDDMDDDEDEDMVEFKEVPEITETEMKKTEKLIQKLDKLGEVEERVMSTEFVAKDNEEMKELKMKIKNVRNMIDEKKSEIVEKLKSKKVPFFSQWKFFSNKMIKLHEKFIDATSVEEKQAILKMMKTCRIVFCIKTKLNKYFFIRNMLNEDVARDARIINVINNEIDLLEEKMDRIFDDDMLVESKVYQTTTMKPVPMKVEEVYDQVAQEINVRELLKKKIDEEKDEVVKDDKLKIEDLKEVIKRIVEETKNEKKVKETKEEIKGQVKEMKKREMKTNEKVKVLIEKIKKEMKNVEEADIDPILLKKINKLLTQFGEVKEFERRQLNLPQPTHQMMEEIKQRMRTDGVDDTVLPNGRPFTFAEFKEFTNDLNNKIVKGDMEVPEIMKMMKMKNQRH